jgi:hypothetical protein
VKASARKTELGDYCLKLGDAGVQFALSRGGVRRYLHALHIGASRPGLEPFFRSVNGYIRSTVNGIPGVTS